LEKRVLIIDRHLIDEEFAKILETEILGYDVIIKPTYEKAETVEEKNDVSIISGLVFGWNLQSLCDTYDISIMYDNGKLRLSRKV